MTRLVFKILCMVYKKTSTVKIELQNNRQLVENKTQIMQHLLQMHRFPCLLICKMKT
jgi:hypothetical protein